MSTRDALTDKLAECAAEGMGARETAVTILADPVLLDEICEYRARQINAEKAKKVRQPSWYRTLERSFATEHFGFPPVPTTGQSQTASDGSVWVFELTGPNQWWELSQYAPLPEDGQPCETCGGTGAVVCWSPGGPCRTSPCEACGPCTSCKAGES